MMQLKLLEIGGIASTTYKELIRSRVLYALCAALVAALGLATFFGTVTIGDRAKVVLDFGIFCVSLWSVVFVTIAGTSLLAKELSRKTIFNILAKPIDRHTFVLGKFAGLYFTSLVVIAVTSLIVWIYSLIVGGGAVQAVPVSAFFIALECLILTAVAIFFSSVLITPALSGVLTFAVFLAGRCAQYLLFYIGDESLGATFRAGLRGLYFALPHLDRMYVANGAVYGDFPTLSFAVWSVLYSAAYAGVFLILAGFFFSHKEFR